MIVKIFFPFLAEKKRGIVHSQISSTEKGEKLRNIINEINKWTDLHLDNLKFEIPHPAYCGNNFERSTMTFLFHNSGEAIYYLSENKLVLYDLKTEQALKIIPFSNKNSILVDISCSQRWCATYSSFYEYINHY
jgi:hypothetical protein